RSEPRYCSVAYLTTLPPPPSTHFPYTPLFRSEPLSFVAARWLLTPPQEITDVPSSVLFATDRSGRDVLLFPSTWAIDYTERQNRDRKSTRLNSSHVKISYAVFCLKKKIHSLSG